MARRLLTLLAALLLALAIGQPSASAATVTNPIKAQKGADPWISYHDGNYYLVTTSWTNVITMRKSATLAGLATAPNIQVWTGDAASRCCNIWAPEIHFLDGRWYLYYVAGQNVTDYNPTQRTHVLESAGSDPTGPYTYKNQLNSAWMLDPTVATINGRLYLFGSASGGTQNLVAARMSNPYTLATGFSTISTPTNSWEKSGGSVNEGPEILQRGGQTFLVYSASGCWTPDYKFEQAHPHRLRPARGIVLDEEVHTGVPAQRLRGRVRPGPQRLLQLAGRHRELDRLPRQRLGLGRLRQRPYDPGPEVHLELRRHPEPGHARGTGLGRERPLR